MKTLREVLRDSGWESFSYSTIKNLHMRTLDIIQSGYSEWLDSKVQACYSEMIIDCYGDELEEVNVWEADLLDEPTYTGEHNTAGQ